MPQPFLAQPVVSMLWESTDPAEALNSRFGFADGVSAVGWTDHALWDTWALAVDDCDRLVISDRNLLAWITTEGRRLIAKWSIRPRLFQRLADTATLTMWLQASGIPVAAPIPAKNGRLRVELSGVSLGVCPAVDGDLLDVGDPAQVTEAGHMLARLHEALSAYPHRIDGGRPTRREQLVITAFGLGPEQAARIVRWSEEAAARRLVRGRRRVAGGEAAVDLLALLRSRDRGVDRSAPS